MGESTHCTHTVVRPGVSATTETQGASRSLDDLETKTNWKDDSGVHRERTAAVLPVMVCEFPAVDARLTPKRLYGVLSKPAGLLFIDRDPNQH